MTTREVHVGGLDGVGLLAALTQAGVRVNAFGLALLSSGAFEAVEPRRAVTIVEVSVRDLRLPGGANTFTLYETALKSELALCPLALGPYLRLQWLDQPEGSVEHQDGPRRAPPGAITVASAWPDEREELPQGFYLRQIDGTPWLRGFRSDAEHVWDPEDRFIFCTTDAARRVSL